MSVNGENKMEGGMPSVGVFLRDPRLYSCVYRRKPRKTPNGPGFEPGTSHLAVLRAEPLGHWWGPTKFVTTTLKRVFENTSKIFL